MGASLGTALSKLGLDMALALPEKLEKQHALGLGVATVACLGAGVALAAAGRGTKEVKEAKASETARGQGLAPTDSNKGASQRELCAARSQVAALRAELDATKKQPTEASKKKVAEELLAAQKEIEDLRAVLKQCAGAEKRERQTQGDQVKALRAELDTLKAQHTEELKTMRGQAEALRKELQESAVEARAGEAAHCQESASLKKEREAADLNLEAAQSKLRNLRADMEVMAQGVEVLVKERADSQRHAEAREKEQDTLQKELAVNKQKSRKSFDSVKSVTSTLDHLLKDLETAESSWTPRKDIGRIKGSLEKMRSMSQEEDLEELDVFLGA